MVFTSIAAFWAQVEYRSKQMVPWVLMAQGPQTAWNSLLLDYIEPMNIISLYNSFLNRHWMVVAAIAEDVFNMTALVDVFSADLSIDISPTPGVPFTIGSLTLQLAAPTFSPSLGLVCKPSYSIRKGSVTLSKDADGATTPSISFSGNETASTLPNVTSWDVLGAFAQSVAQAETSTSSPSLAALINATTPQPSSARDADTTAAALAQLFRLASAQVAHGRLKAATQTRIGGAAARCCWP
ncbi:hypothetical protein UCRNP2_2087 [Neofusicoccum parvum UCRNP2]|uniref:Uncharacterized protein n=1 Tax=Botryosphaeria parva (strain UCR-NP2) TaxID=1287680 RepID=R1EU63_BOTPV|nr:hypothetical protein UCRNP2_2087 [Neofusicoccum parvum UCRNP2]